MITALTTESLAERASAPGVPRSTLEQLAGDLAIAKTRGLGCDDLAQVAQAAAAGANGTAR